MTPAAVPPPSAFVQRPRESRYGAPEKPFAGLFAAFPHHNPDAIQKAIDKLKASGRRSIRVGDVAKIIGRVPMPAPLPPVVVAIVAAEPPQSDEECDRQSMARVAAACTGKPDSLAAKLKRCFGRPGLTEAEETRYQVLTARWRDFGYLPSANRYAAECCE